MFLLGLREMWAAAAAAKTTRVLVKKKATEPKVDEKRAELQALQLTVRKLEAKMAALIEAQRAERLAELPGLVDQKEDAERAAKDQVAELEAQLQTAQDNLAVARNVLAVWQMRREAAEQAVEDAQAALAAALAAGQPGTDEQEALDAALVTLEQNQIAEDIERTQFAQAEEQLRAVESALRNAREAADLAGAAVDGAHEVRDAAAAGREAIRLLAYATEARLKAQGKVTKAGQDLVQLSTTPRGLDPTTVLQVAQQDLAAAQAARQLAADELAVAMSTLGVKVSYRDAAQAAYDAAIAAEEDASA